MKEVMIGEKVVPVYFLDNFKVSDKVVIESTVFQDWKNSLDPGFSVRSVYVQSVDTFGGRVGFLKIKAYGFDTDGVGFSRICFLRGGTVVMMPILECEGVKYTLLTSQSRIPIGAAAFLELPAGMIDDSGDFSGTAAKEIEEETGLVFNQDQLIDVSPNQKPVYLSPGGSDEFARFFITEKMLVSRKELDEMNGRITGAPGENERIKVRVILLDELFEATQDGTSFIMLAAYDKYKNTL
ncbi:NUDIX domain-containing protein [Patescibacteria group bacterium]